MALTHALFSDLPVLVQESIASSLPVFVLAPKVLGMIACARVRNGAGPFNRLATGRRGAKRVVDLVIVVLAIRPLLVDVERTVRKRLLKTRH
jgi:hypothetical protein